MKLIKILIALFIISLFLVFLPGCKPEANIEMKFAPQQTHTYKAVAHSRKDYLFDQPSDDKKTEKMSETIFEMVYDQTIDSVDEQGNADATITIKGIKFISKDKDGVDTNYDSSNPESKPKELSELLGRSYQIKMSPNGKVISMSGLDEAAQGITGREASKLVKNILSKDAITKIHTIKALPEPENKKLKVGDKWTQKESSPKSALVVKTFDKIYSVSEIKETPSGNIAHIEMQSSPASAKADQAQANYGSMGVFGNMFESEDSFTGNIKFDMDSGKIHNYQEKFVGKYTAVQFSESQPEADPMKLQLGYTEIHSIESID